MLDIIIINYNSTDCLIQCLGSLAEAAGRIQINVLVADNNSRDHAQRIAAMFPGVQLLANHKNIGFAKAVNQCILKSSSPYLMLLNPDTIAAPGAFASMLSYMESHSDVGILGPAIYDHDRKIQGSARSFPTPFTAFFGRSSLLTRLFPNNRVTCRNILNKASDGETPIPVDWLSGACMLVRSKAVKEVGLLDSNFFMYWEDADWCRRMTKKGWKVVYYPNASVTHYIGVSSEQNLTRAVVEFHKSAYYLFNKYYPSTPGSAKILVMLGLTARAGFLMALHWLRRRYLR